MPTPATPLQAYIGVQVGVDREMAKILLDAAKESERIVQRLGEKAGIGSQVRQAQLRMMNRELRNVVEQMYGGPITKTMRAGMEKAAVAAVQSEQFVSQVLTSAFGERIPALEQAFAEQARLSVETIYARGQNGIPLSQQVYKTSALSSGAVDRAVNRAIVLQMSAAELATTVRRLISPMTPGGVSYAANRLARTELNNAFHTAQINRRKDEPWTEGFKWNLSGSHPRPDECNDYANSAHFKGGDPGVFKPDSVPGKPHPNCLCYLTTVTVGEDEFIDNFLKGDYTGYMDEQMQRSGFGVC